MKRLFALAVLAFTLAVAGFAGTAHASPYVTCGPNCGSGGSSPPSSPCNSFWYGTYAYNPYPYLYQCGYIYGRGYEWEFIGIVY